MLRFAVVSPSGRGVYNLAGRSAPLIFVSTFAHELPLIV